MTRNNRQQRAFSRRDGARRIALWLVCALVLQALAGTATASLRAAERNALLAMGLLDAVICHGDPIGASSALDKHRGAVPGQPASHGTTCDCCLTGCATSGPAALPSDHGALLRPLIAANCATVVALDAAALRSFVEERTRNPRSPPLIG